MKAGVIIDTNLLILLIVGSASRGLIRKHDRLQGYSLYDFDLLGLIVSGFSDVFTVPHVLAETSNLARQIYPQARGLIDAAFKRFVQETTELTIASLFGCSRVEFSRFGLTDATLVHICSLEIAGQPTTLLTDDTALADAALSLGCKVIDFKREYQSKS